MTRSAWLVAALALAAAGGCDAKGNQPGMIVMPGMVQSLPYDAYDENPITGQTLRLLPEGTVPYGAKRLHYTAGPKEAARAGRELVNPLEASETNLARGKAKYDIFCAVCHGPGGQGDGPIIGRFPNPPSLLSPRAKQLPDGHVFHVISFGQGIMAPYGLQVRQEDRWRIVQYVRSMQGIGAVPPPTETVEPDADAEEPADAPDTEDGDAPAPQVPLPKAPAPAEPYRD